MGVATEIISGKFRVGQRRRNIFIEVDYSVLVVARIIALTWYLKCMWNISG